jgi:hypothetical protein
LCFATLPRKKELDPRTHMPRQLQLRQLLRQFLRRGCDHRAAQFAAAIAIRVHREAATIAGSCTRAS